MHPVGVESATTSMLYVYKQKQRNFIHSMRMANSCAWRLTSLFTYRYGCFSLGYGCHTAAAIAIPSLWPHGKMYCVQERKLGLKGNM